MHVMNPTGKDITVYIVENLNCVLDSAMATVSEHRKKSIDES